MTFFWGVVAVVILAAMAVALGRHASRHRPRFIDSAAWTEEHWRERHERDKAAQQRAIEGL
jgi:hypothetical protein